MIVNSCLTRRPGLRSPRRSLIRGFSLLEVVLVLFVLGLLAAALAPSVRDLLATGRRNSEVKSLDQLADTSDATQPLSSPA